MLQGKALLLLTSGRYTEAISPSQRLLNQSPNAYPAYHLMASSLLSLGRFDEAIPMLETAIRRDPRSARNYDLYAQMALALQNLGRLQESIV